MGADHITKDMTMQEILAVFPGAQRALFSRYHPKSLTNSRLISGESAKHRVRYVLTKGSQLLLLLLLLLRRSHGFDKALALKPRRAESW
jgi:hypothetical protein